MRCNNCENSVSERDNFCSVCGSEVQVNLFTKQQYGNRDIKLLLGYCSWLVFSNVVFATIGKFLVPTMIANGQPLKASELLVTAELVIITVDVLLVFFASIFATGKLAKTGFVVFLVFKIVLLGSTVLNYRALGS